MRSVRVASMVGLLALAAAAQTPPQPDPTAKEPAAPLVFAWPLPATAWVTKVGTKPTGTAKLRYRIDLAAVAADAAEPDRPVELRLRQTDFSFVEINGQDATTEAMQKALAQANALTQAVPDVVVDAAGAFVRIDGLDAMITRVTEYMATSKGMTEQQRRRIEFSMKAPTMRATLQQSCGDDWNLWVGAWVGTALRPGESLRGEGNLPVLTTTLPGTTTMQHHGEVEGRPGCVRLTRTVVVEGDEATARFAAAIKKMAAAGGKPPVEFDQLQSMRAELQAEVVVEAATLRPMRATRTKTIRMQVEGQEPREQVETATFEFEWLPAGR
ncbi:MAG: hypothetical protein RL398_506 [Planctomycetota bacterium]|jgi:hypothetical protein